MMKLKTKIATATLLAGTCICIVGGTSWGGAEATIAKAATIPTNANARAVVSADHYVHFTSDLLDGKTEIAGTSYIWGDPYPYKVNKVQLNINDKGWSNAVVADYSGNWTIKVNKLRTGDRVKARTTFYDGVVVESEDVVKALSDAPLIRADMSEGVSVIVGAADPNMIVKIRDYATDRDLAIGEVKADARGIWTAYLAAPLREGMTIYAVGYWPGYPDAPRQSTLKPVGAAENPTITTKLIDGGTALSGKAAGGSTIELWNSTTKIGTTTANALGEWSTTVQPLVGGDMLKVKATLFGKVTESNRNYRVNVEPLVVSNSLTTESTKVSGKGTIGATVSVYVDGAVIGHGVVGSNREFEVTFPKQAAGKRVLITQTKNGAFSDPVELFVALKLDKLTEISAITTNSTKVTGKGYPGATVKVKAAGKDIGVGEVDVDGNFEVTIKPQAAGTELTINQTKDGEESDSVTVTVVSAQLAAPSITTFYVGTTYLRGTAPTGAAKVTLIIAGKNIRTVDVAADGSYRIYANDVAALKLAGTTFEVVAQDANGNFSEAATGTVQELLAAPVVATYRAGQAYVTGTVSDEVTKISVYDKAGTLLRNGQVNADGTFRIYVSGVAALQIVGDTFTVRASNENGTTSETRVTIEAK
ncbi:Ig-like domain-containing protein [Listeria grandensis]|uniref:Ig-like domain-containing protein n=1 Tax=Listeria grandensis TaxID=1494963 RepID=UPI00164D97B0|nr:Ig-like domain-containing protein [Listeria grandensis]MBC6314431.1 hypothetical protein [Listeria grandensis]